MPAKPHKWVYKQFVLCGASDSSYSFEINRGSENQSQLELPDELELEATSNTVVPLSRVVPNNLDHVVHFDDYYTPLPLM